SHLRFFLYVALHTAPLPSFPTRRSSDLNSALPLAPPIRSVITWRITITWAMPDARKASTLISTNTTAASASPPSSRMELTPTLRSEEHTSELQSLRHLVCRLLLEKKKDL